MKIGYARVSTEDQNLALQLDALQAEGCGQVFQDTASGASSNRKGLAAALDACAAGDVLTVWKLDRGMVQRWITREGGLTPPGRMTAP